MNFPTSFLDEIRARLRVSDVVSAKVKLTKRGREFVGLSPFNQEKTPSFTVNDQKGFYHCFSSGKHGDIFRFLMETEGLSFPEAVERLAAKAGVAMPARDPQAEIKQARRASLYDVMNLAAAFFEDQLQQNAGAQARGYLADRGLTPDIQKTFQIGFAPSGRSELKQYLAAKDISQEQMIAAGLIIAGEDIAVSYDRFRDRVMFPITDARDRVIAFGGRALRADVPAKYLNSPETELFHKGSVLYNLARARTASHASGNIVAVEGYTDVIAMAGAGFENAVAPLGTALTQDQIQLLWRMAPEPILCFDGDKAGLKAAYRALDLVLPMLRPGHSLRFAVLPEGLDPDDLIRDHGAAALRDVLDAARPLIDMLWSREVEQGDVTTPERRAGLEARIDQSIGEIKDVKVQRHYQTIIREKLREFWRAQRPANARGRGSYSQDRYRDIPGNNRYGRRGARQAARAPTQSLRSSPLARGYSAAVSRRELLVIQTVLNHPQLLLQCSEEFADVEFSSAELDRLRNVILEIAAHVDPLDNARLLNDLEAKGVSEIVARVARGLGSQKEWFSEPGAAEVDAETGWRHMLALHRRSLTLQRELKAAERALAQDQSEENLAVLLDVQRELEGVEGTEATVRGWGEASDRPTGTDY